KLGDLLLSKGGITSEQLAEALLAQSENGSRLGEILVEQGLLSDASLAQALSDQLGLDLIDLRRITPEPEALLLIPETTVRAHHALPIALEDGVLSVVVPGVLGGGAMRQLKNAASDVRITFVLAP